MDLVEGEDWDAPSTIKFRSIVHVQARALISMVQAAICHLADSVYCHYKDQGMRSTNNSGVPCMIHPQYDGSFATEATLTTIKLCGYRMYS